jgi:hypothetical protein
MAYQDTGKKVVTFMIVAMLLSFAALIALWAMGSIPTTSYPQVVHANKIPARLAITADASRPGLSGSAAYLLLRSLRASPTTPLPSSSRLPGSGTLCVL